MKIRNYINCFIGCLFFLIALILLIVIIYYNGEIKIIILQSIIFCLNNIVPTLFSTILISNIILSIGIPSKFKLKLNKIFIKLFSITSNSLEAVILGLLGGYNMSFIASIELLKNNLIKLYEAKKIVLCCTCPGMSFCVLIVGKSLFNSDKLGYLLLISSIVSSVLMLIFTKSTKDQIQNCSNNQVLDKSNSMNIVSSVNNTIKALISICSWIVVFRLFSFLLKKFLNVKIIIAFFDLFGEIINSMEYTHNNCSVYVTCFSLMFGGLCVFFQQLPFLKYLEITPLLFVFYKIKHSLTATFVFYILSILFPIKTYTANINFTSNMKLTITGLLSLILLFFILSFELVNAKNKKIIFNIAQTKN